MMYSTSLWLIQLKLKCLQESDEEHPGLAKLLPYLSQLQDAGESVEVLNFPLADLIGADAQLNSFYRYNGSLTTPTCNEIVQVWPTIWGLALNIWDLILQWTLLKNPVNATKYQLSQFRQLLTQDHAPLGAKLIFDDWHCIKIFCLQLTISGRCNLWTEEKFSAWQRAVLAGALSSILQEHSGWHLRKDYEFNISFIFRINGMVSLIVAVVIMIVRL